MRLIIIIYIYAAFAVRGGFVSQEREYKGAWLSAFLGLSQVPWKS